MAEQFINLLAVIGGVMLMMRITERVRRIFAPKKRVQRVPRCESYHDGVPQTIRIANEFAEYTETLKRTPIRKATGWFSDTDAQELVK